MSRNGHNGRREVPRRHNVYVIELKRAVLREKRFSEANPQHDQRKPCVYVGLTGLSPRERFERHLAGRQASRLVRKYGIRLRPRHYARLDPMPYAEAVVMERALAIKLRKKGYAVWQK